MYNHVYYTPGIHIIFMHALLPPSRAQKIQKVTSSEILNLISLSLRKCEELHSDVGPVEVTPVTPMTPSPWRATVALMALVGLAVAALVAGTTMATEETMRRLKIQETLSGSPKR